ncbi:hypothetical protein PIB30_100973 [Stylosanthes scabra]|uniref:Uncharacterized protein n=1 Tax=Stylosanthes scabra TaxID=79078 RepID=A0ABU6TX01_9FABA|nr:hypothetical protein [Stylosanthes scabra]
MVLEEVLREENRIDSLVPDFEFNVQNCLRVDSSSSESILKNVNVRGDERVVLGELRTVVVQDMYWTGRVGYDNRPGELTLAVGNRHASYAFVCRFQHGKWRSMLYVAEVLSKGFQNPLDYGFGSSVRSVTISAERVRGAVSHIGVLHLVSEQFFPCEPEEWNCYALEHNLNQRIMRKMLLKATI